MKRPLAALLGILLVLSICVGCGPKGDISSGVAEQDFPVTVNEVTIQDEPKGVVVLSPNLAEVIMALGYEMQLCGKGAACTQEDLSVLPDMTLDDPQSILGLAQTWSSRRTRPVKNRKRAQRRGDRCGDHCARYQPRRFYPPVPGGRFLHDGRREGIRTRGEDR